MASLAENVVGFFRPPALPGQARATYRLHLAYALLDAVSGGIVLNMPLVARRAMHAPNSQLYLRDLYSGIGMLATLYLGSWMARRRKMPFVFVPGILCVVCSLGMTLLTDRSYWFLTLFGLGAMFEVTTRPALATILRSIYPPTHRGLATGEVRKWSSLAFVTAILLSAWLLGRAGQDEIEMATWQIRLAAFSSLLSFFCLRAIRVPDEPETFGDFRPEFIKNLRDAVAVLVRDGRYRRYLLSCFLDGFCQLLYFALLWTFFDKTLGFGYVGCSALMHAVPTLTAFLVTGWLGSWFDRANPWISWAWIRFGYGVDVLLLAATVPLMALVPLAAAPWSQIEAVARSAPLEAALPLAVLALPFVARIIRGSVQGGQYVLWWQIGVTHFAPPGEDTSRYLGIMVFLSGAIRFLASAAGIVLASMRVEPITLMVVGGCGVILSGVYSLWQAARERREHRPETIAEFEAQFKR